MTTWDRIPLLSNPHRNGILCHIFAHAPVTKPVPGARKNSFTPLATNAANNL